MEPDDDDDVTETSRIFVLGENGSVQHSETIKLYPVVPGHAGSVEDVSKVSDKNVRRSHSLGNVRFSLNDVSISPGHFILIEFFSIDFSALNSEFVLCLLYSTQHHRYLGQ